MKVRRTIDREAPRLGQRIREARVADGRALEIICAHVGISRVHWYDIEAEKIRNALPEDTLRKI